MVKMTVFHGHCFVIGNNRRKIAHIRSKYNTNKLSVKKSHPQLFGIEDAGCRPGRIIL
jgi:hypothetical protein